MIRIVTDFVPRPAVLVICDNANCGNVITAPVGDPGDVKELQAFVAKAQLEGWMLNILGHQCPAHVQAAKKAQPMVKVFQGNGLH